MKNYENGNYSECSRCGSLSLEHLQTYCHCANCFYCPDIDEPKDPAIARTMMLALRVEESSKTSTEAAPSQVTKKAVGW
ncbi:MAG: hypothetical protein JST16_03760 [Bdellovibrionales bacterium]|nr:hypothetical protein [Bdellovibrionales bacterium]